MGSILRRTAIGLIALAVVFAAYVLYNRLGGTPTIENRTADDFSDYSANGSQAVPDANVGRVGDIGVGDVTGGEYYHRNAQREIDRKFGFEKLLHKVRNNWKIENPYMYVYQPNFECSITADTGSVEIETVASRPSPKDASFNGNVVIRISPRDERSDVGEGTIYMDDVVFVSDKSLFSTAGPVRFVSDDAEMVGTGLEMIYDEDAERIDYFKIIELDSLHVSSSKTSLASMSGDTEKGTRQQSIDNIGNDSGEGTYYKCIFSDNVRISTPEQLLISRQMVSINDIFWAKSSDANEPDSPAEEETVAADGSGQEQADPNDQTGVDVVITCDGGVLLVPSGSARAAEAEAKAAAIAFDVNDILAGEKLPERTTFVTPRIDHSLATEESIATGPTRLVFLARDANAPDPNKAMFPVTVTAQDRTRFLSKTNQVIFEGDCKTVMPSRDPNAEHDYVLTSPTITVDILESESSDPFTTADIVAGGPVNFDFWTDAVDSNDATKALPVNILAQRHARFEAAQRRIVFEGNCRCTMTDEDPNAVEQFILSAPRLTVDMPNDVDDESSELAANFKNIRADGGTVHLATVRTAKADSILARNLGLDEQALGLGGVELKCSRFDYDPNSAIAVASGPGSIRFDNTKIPEPNDDSDGLSLRKPCYALVQNFSELRYYLDQNQIVAESPSDGSLLVDYFPITEGKYGQHIVAQAKKVEASLYKTVDGQTELASLRASGGITYNDDKNEFIGSEMVYDHEKGVLKVDGDSKQPCYLNGALVKSITYDMATGKASGEVAAPGAIQFK